MSKTVTSLASEALASCSYDDETRDLVVTFTNGRSYTLRDVPDEVHQGLVMAESAGGYWHAVLKGNY
jgi:hypothetical protein